MTLSIRERAYAALPGYTEAKKIIAASSTRQAEIPKSELAAARADLNHEIRKSLLDGTPLPVEHNAEQAEREFRKLNMFDTEFRMVVENAKSDLEAILANDPDEAFASLRGDLAVMIGRVRELIPILNGATASAEVVSRGAGAVEAWNSISELTETYDEIRTVQLELSKEPFAGKHEQFYGTALYRDGINLSSYWRDRRANAVRNSSETKSEHLKWLASAESLPAANDEKLSWWPSGVERTTHLIHLAVEVSTWVPNLSALQEAIKWANKATIPVHAGNGSYGQRTEADHTFALEQYRRVTNGDETQELSQTPTDLARHHQIAAKLQRDVAALALTSERQRASQIATNDAYNARF